MGVEQDLTETIGWSLVKLMSVIIIGALVVVWLEQEDKK